MLTREKMSCFYALVPTPYKGDGVFDEATFRENTPEFSVIYIT